MRARLQAVPRFELLAYAALVAIALALRLIDLGDRPFHHDESQDAYFSWVERFEYDPLLHGPLRFYLTAAMYAIFGASDVTARLAPALMGTIAVALPFLLRRQLGRAGAFAAAVLLAAGPSYLYFSRFAREDIYVAAITLGMLVVVWRLLDSPSRAHPAILGALLAASFATKETTFITVFAAGTFLGPLALWQAIRHRHASGGWREAPLIRTVTGLGWEAWAWGAASFAVVFTLLFTIFLTYPAGLWSGIYDGIAYWLDQHGVARGGEGPAFYLILLFGEEWPVLALAAVGVAAVVRAPTIPRLLLIWFFGCSLAVYSWAGEKFAWLILHPLLPLILLAGLGVQLAWDTRRAWTGKAGLTLAAVGALYLAQASFTVNARNGADPRELLVSTQSSTDVLGVRDQVLAAAKRSPTPLTVSVDTTDGATFPWAWYFRDLRAGYVDMVDPAFVPQSQVLILTESARQRLLPQLAAYEGRRFDLRVWWVKDYSDALSPGNWARWMTEREPWDPTGGMAEWVYVRRDVAS